MPYQKQIDNMRLPRILNRELFTEICYEFARVQMEFDEPIPKITKEGLDHIEGCLKKPIAGSKDGLFFNTISEQAAALFYCICKNHCLENGNKRMAIITTIIFLLINGYQLKVESTTKLLYLIAYCTAASPSNRDELVKEGLVQFFSNSIEEFDLSTFITKSLI